MANVRKFVSYDQYSCKIFNVIRRLGNRAVLHVVDDFQFREEVLPARGNNYCWVKLRQGYFNGVSRQQWPIKKNIVSAICASGGAFSPAI